MDVASGLRGIWWSCNQRGVNRLGSANTSCYWENTNTCLSLL